MARYEQWPHAALVARIRLLEQEQLDKHALSPTPSKKKLFDYSRHSSRPIALKVAYLGGNYNGFEYHAKSHTPLPTVEEEIFKALLKARLVPAHLDAIDGNEEDLSAWPGDEAVGYSKCGRTDRGVSAFGQVLGITVRSNRPLPKASSGSIDQSGEGVSLGNGTAKEPEDELVDGLGMDFDENSESESEHHISEFDDIKDELAYPALLNNLLPPDIRILAWCPSPSGFSARFNCLERRYKYFFTNPSIAPTSSGEGTLNIEKMQEAAKLYQGTHDFRNLCKLDASKQISNFERVIHHASIQEVNPIPPTFPGLIPEGNGTTTGGPKVYTFNLHGSAFLWHQVRHMVAILFLIGQGLEQPSLVTSLLDVKTIPTKPLYEMASDHPLVLWDCVFPENELKWIPAETHSLTRGAGKEGRSALIDALWGTWHKARIQEVLAGGLLDLIHNHRGGEPEPEESSGKEQRGGDGDNGDGSKKSQIVVDGGNGPVLRGAYIPVLQRRRMEDVEVINKRFAERKGDWRERARRKWVEKS